MQGRLQLQALQVLQELQVLPELLLMLQGPSGLLQVGCQGRYRQLQVMQQLVLELLQGLQQILQQLELEVLRELQVLVSCVW